MKHLCSGLFWGVVLGALALLSPAADSVEFHVAYSFCNPGKSTDGNDAAGTLMEVNGTLYGLTTGGGKYYGGTAYSFDRSTGVETLLHSFGSGGDGSMPFGGMIDVNGVLYGTTFAGGNAQCSGGCGTVFSLDPSSG